MENKGKINQKETKGNVPLWKYAGLIAALMVFGALGIQFMNQSETEELSIENNQETVIKEELKQEETPVLEKAPENKETIVSSSSTKKKVFKPKNKGIDEDLLAERSVVEDTITATKVVSERYNGSFISCGGRWAYPSLKISTGTGNHLEKNRQPETILKDAEALTRNGNYTYIVDGVRVSEETFRSLNQNDIESIDIYKHTDVYNARFGNKENQSRIALESR